MRPTSSAEALACAACISSQILYTQVFCNGEEVLSTSGTRGEYVVDIWSGNHPFFQGSNNSVVLDEGRVNKFNKRFSGARAALFSTLTLQEIVSVAREQTAFASLGQHARCTVYVCDT